MTDRNYSHLILVVDDEAGIIRLCRRLLEKGGFRVAAFTDPHEGLAFLQRDQASLLLVDIRMPGMDGFELMEQACQQQPDLAVVIMTGYGTVETAIEALHKGADGLVLKPFTGKELVESVHRALIDNQQKRDAVRLRTLRPLFATTESLFAETDPEKLQQLFLKCVCDHLRCDRAGFYLRYPAESGYKLTAQVGEPLTRIDSPFMQGLLRIVEEEQLAQSLGVETDIEDERAFLQLNQLGTLLLVPVHKSSSMENMGSILLAGKNTGDNRFSSSDLEIASILARQAGVAMENARLHSDLLANIRQVEESQQALIQAEKMAVAGRLTASIAHEINNPLQSVRNCLHLAGRMELTPEQRLNYHQMAKLELDRLMQTVQQMLDYFRPGSLDRKPVDLNEIVRRVLFLVDNQLLDNHIKYQIDYAPDLPQVMAVSDQIQQVLLNLVLNAMEAMPGGGNLLITTRASKDEVEILVEDSGPGIAPQDRERIFEPFVSTKDGGTGLGLAVSYGIISAHGGSLGIVEGAGTGACFRVSLPIGGSS
jgi:two-component system NtrC family sensor kinase